MEVAMAQEETKRLKIQGDMQNDANRFQLDQVKFQKESDKLDSEVLVNYAQAGKLVKDTEMAETKSDLNILDNIIVAKSKENEMEDRKEDRRFKAAVELAKLENQQVKIPKTIQENKNEE
jgi:hypothetical protein